MATWGFFLSGEHAILDNPPLTEIWRKLMDLSEEQLVEFALLYRDHCGVELTREETYEYATRLLGLYKFVYRPMSEEQFKAIGELQRKEEEAKANPNNP
jgi:hypothetical protein